MPRLAGTRLVVSGRARSRQQRVAAAKRRFCDFYPDGFSDADYLALERRYKWEAHRRWARALGRGTYEARLEAGDHEGIAHDAVRIEAATNLLFSFEKIAIRDAVRSPAGAKTFAEGLFDWLYGPGAQSTRFALWRETLAALPRRGTRVLTWPVLTSFGFLARPKVHMMLKPVVTRRAASAYGFEMHYRPDPQWRTYEDLLAFAHILRLDLAEWCPRDMIDLQSFIWVLGSSEYD